jgi:hypothetical protein
MGQQNHYRQFKRHTNHYGEEQEEAEVVGEMEVAFNSPIKMLLLYVARPTVITGDPGDHCMRRARDSEAHCEADDAQRCAEEHTQGGGLLCL